MIMYTAGHILAYTSWHDRVSSHESWSVITCVHSDTRVHELVRNDALFFVVISTLLNGPEWFNFLIDTVE